MMALGAMLTFFLGNGAKKPTTYFINLRSSSLVALKTLIISFVVHGNIFARIGLADSTAKLALISCDKFL